MLSTRKRKDVQAVTTIESLIEGWNNPFTERKELVSLSTAKQAPEDVTRDLLNGRKVGEEAYQVFKEQRLESSPPQKKFHDTMKLNKLKTFSSLSQKKKVSTDGRTMVLKDRSLFGRIIIISQSRKIDVRELLQYSLGPLLWSLATTEGFPRKTNKAALALSLIHI